ncbi:hypothetical protein HUJ05_003264 [Dendroctonus ponderosae]|nr:hypothetical protein HUJ05_003264 [Dendroctonus ponderosae]
MVTLMPCNYLNAAQNSRCTMIDKMCEPKVKRARTDANDSTERDRFPEFSAGINRVFPLILNQKPKTVLTTPNRVELNETMEASNYLRPLDDGVV